MSTDTPTYQGTPPRSFEKLNKLFTLRILADDGDLEDALHIAHWLAKLERRSPDQEVYLESLSMLVERYEAANHRLETADLDPVDTLKFLVEQHGISPSGIGAEVLRGDRPLTKSIVLKFAAFFGVGPGVFLPE